MGTELERGEKKSLKSKIEKKINPRRTAITEEEKIES